MARIGEKYGAIDTGQAWHCDDVQFELDVIGFDKVDPERAKRLRIMPTKLSLTPEEIDLAVQAGREATWKSAVLQRYVQRKIGGAERLSR